MWVFFDNNGAMRIKLEHGIPARQGQVGVFSVFAYFNDLNLDEYSFATLSLAHDGNLMSQSALIGDRTKQLFIRQKDETDISPFISQNIYEGYKFDFDDNYFTAHGLYTATIRVYKGETVYVTGTFTFNVEQSVVGDDDIIIKADGWEHLMSKLSTFVRKYENYYLRVLDSKVYYMNDDMEVIPNTRYTIKSFHSYLDPDLGDDYTGDTDIALVKDEKAIYEVQYVGDGETDLFRYHSIEAGNVTFDDNIIFENEGTIENFYFTANDEEFTGMKLELDTMSHYVLKYIDKNGNETTVYDGVQWDAHENYQTITLAKEQMLLNDNEIALFEANTPEDTVKEKSISAFFQYDKIIDLDDDIDDLKERVEALEANKYDTVETTGNGNVITSIEEDSTNHNKINIQKDIQVYAKSEVYNKQETNDLLAEKEDIKPYTSLERLASYLYRISFDNVPEEDTSILPTIGGGCTSFVRNGKLYRNLDWNYDNTAEFLVQCKGFKGMSFIPNVNDGNLDSEILGQLPYHINDGVNESGIMVSSHVIYNDFSYSSLGKTTHLTKLPYIILNNLHSMNNISSVLTPYLSDLKVNAGLGSYLMQFMVTDGATTYVVLPTSNSNYELVNATNNPKLTNFRWISQKIIDRSSVEDRALLQTRPTGIERWNLIEDNATLEGLRFTKCYESNNRLSEFIGENNTNKDTLDTVLQVIYNTAHNKYLTRTRNGELWQTVHSIVYSSKGIEHLNVQENYDIDYASGSGSESVDVPVQSVNGKIGNVVLVADDIKVLNNQSIQANLERIDGEIEDIYDKIPNQATSTNQLADKAFVNSTINSLASFFKGSFSTLTDLDSYGWQTTDPEAFGYVSNNDYAYVEADETHDGEAWRYMWTTINGFSGWTAQFKVNDTPFTAEQLSAINSGISASQVSAIPNTASSSNKLVTANELPDTSDLAQDSQVVHNTGNENVYGVKTFISNPIVPTPTTSNQTANKSYVDSKSRTFVVTFLSNFNTTFGKSVSATTETFSISGNPSDYDETDYAGIFDLKRGDLLVFDALSSGNDVPVFIVNNSGQETETLYAVEFQAVHTSAIDYNDLLNKPTIPSTSTLVTTNTEQTITASKKYQNQTTPIFYYRTSDSDGYLKYQHQGTAFQWQVRWKGNDGLNVALDLIKSTINASSGTDLKTYGCVLPSTNSSNYMMLGKSTNRWYASYTDRVFDKNNSKGTNGQVLTSDGDKIVWANAPTPSGVQYSENGTTQTNPLKFWKGTQAQYDAIVSKDANTFYMIVEE